MRGGLYDVMIEIWYEYVHAIACFLTWAFPLSLALSCTTP